MARKKFRDFVTINSNNDAFMASLDDLREIVFHAENTSKRDNEAAYEAAQSALNQAFTSYGFIGLGIAVSNGADRNTMRKSIADILHAMGAETSGCGIDPIMASIESMTGKVRRRGTEKSGFTGNKSRKAAMQDAAHGILQYAAENGLCGYYLTKTEARVAHKVRKYERRDWTLLAVK